MEHHTRQCAFCGKSLRSDNASGYCGQHGYMSAKSKAYYQERQAASKQESKASYDERPECLHTECTARLRSDNTSGYCRVHVYQPVPMRVCAVSDCGKQITAQSKTGRCQQHRSGKYAAVPVCKKKDCTARLKKSNTSGYCKPHWLETDEYREWMRNYGREHYQNNKDYYKNRARNKVNDKALKVRRRQRELGVYQALPKEDQLISVEYRKAIADDPCRYCGSTEATDVDHIVPLALGGTDHWLNLTKACDFCNSSKHSRYNSFFRQYGLPIPDLPVSPWRETWKSDPAAIALADRHYSRAKPGAGTVGLPAKSLVLITPDESALWVTNMPEEKYRFHAWAGAWECSIFRNESDLLSSSMIRHAVQHTIDKHGPIPEQGFITFVNTKQVKHKRDAGRCFRKAGWEPAGYTKRGLLALKLA